MIILRLKGGLGNQLFQIFRAITLRSPGERILVDYSHFSNRFAADYAGGSFNLRDVLAPATFREIRFFKPHPLISKAIWRFLSFFNCQSSIENRNIKLLDGYFHDIRLIHPDGYKQYLSLGHSYQKQSFPENAVLIHVRKGDYTNEINSKIYYNCDIEYFKKAADLISKSIKDPIYYVMSNDPKWVKENFSFLPAYSILDISDGVLSFKVMCSFSNFIISNSTFSWWPALISGSRCVVAPKNWFLEESKNAHIYPHDWVKV